MIIVKALNTLAKLPKKRNYENEKQKDTTSSVEIRPSIHLHLIYF